MAKKQDQEAFRRELRQYFREGGSLTEGIEMPLVDEHAKKAAKKKQAILDKKANRPVAPPPPPPAPVPDAKKPAPNRRPAKKKKQIQVTSTPADDANTATMNAKIVEQAQVVDYISFDTGIGNGSNITVNDDGTEFLFLLDGMYQFIITVVTNDSPPFDLEVIRTPNFEPTLKVFTGFDLVKNNIAVTLLPIHANDTIKFKLSGVNILPGTQVQMIRVSNR